MIYYSIPLLLILSFLAALSGGCMGSFINCLAWRMTHGESVLKGRSHCDYCSHTLGFFDLIPIGSYIFSGGKCRYCKSKLSPTHLIAELLMALGYIGVLLRYDLSLKTAEGMLFTTVLMAVSLTDIYSRIIPDGFHIFAVIVRLGFIILSGGTVKNLLDAVIGGIAVAGAVLIIVLIFEKVKKIEAMGGGDIKLLFVCGLYLGWRGNILCLLLSCIIGIIWGYAAVKRSGGSENGAFPWGPSIALAAWFSYIFSDYLIKAYLSIFS